MLHSRNGGVTCIFLMVSETKFRDVVPCYHLFLFYQLSNVSAESSSCFAVKFIYFGCDHLVNIRLLGILS